MKDTEDLVRVNFEIPNTQEKLTLEQLINFENIYQILEIEEIDIQNVTLLHARNRAKKFNAVREFNKVYKEYKLELEREKRPELNKINTTEDFPQIPNNEEYLLFCGEWEATSEVINKSELTKEGYIKKVIVCPHPILITKNFNNIEDGIQKTEISFYKNKKWQTLTVDKSTIASTQKIINLADYGIEVTSSTAKDLVDYFHTLNTYNQQLIPYVKSTAKLGWKNKEKTEFTPYDDIYEFDGEQDFKNIYENIRQNGSLWEWINKTEENLKFNIINRFVLCASLVSPFLDFVGVPNYILHLWGGSGKGKTVSMMLGASAWGNPEMGEYMISMNSTNVALEYLSDFLNNLPLFLDELQLIRNTDGYSKFIMSRCQGVGRARGRKEGGIQRSTKWRNITITSGEEPILSETSGGGEMNRVIEMEVKEDTTPDGRYMSNFYRNNYGFLGKMIVNILKEYDPGQLEKEYTKKYNSIKELGTDKQTLGMASIMLVDKILCEKFFELEELTATEVSPFLTTDEDVLPYKRAYDWVLSYINRNRIRFTTDMNDNKGEIWGEIKDGQCFFNKNVLEEKLNEKRFSYKAIIGEWIKNRYAEKFGKDFTNVRRINGELGRYVAINLEEQIFLETKEGELPKGF